MLRSPALRHYTMHHWSQVSCLVFQQHQIYICPSFGHSHSCYCSRRCISVCQQQTHSLRLVAEQPCNQYLAWKHSARLLRSKHHSHHLNQPHRKLLLLHRLPHSRLLTKTKGLRIILSQLQRLKHRPAGLRLQCPPSLSRYHLQRQILWYHLRHW